MNSIAAWSGTALNSLISPSEPKAMNVWLTKNLVTFSIKRFCMWERKHFCMQIIAFGGKNLHLLCNIFQKAEKLHLFTPICLCRCSWAFLFISAIADLEPKVSLINKTQVFLRFLILLGQGKQMKTPTETETNWAKNYLAFYLPFFSKSRSLTVPKLKRLSTEDVLAYPQVFNQSG